jgi:hypothetical protein
MSRAVVNLDDRSPTFEVGILASRMCLVLRRFLRTEDYRVPGTELLDNAIGFFKEGRNGTSYDKPNGTSPQSSVAPALLSKALSRAKEEGHIPNEVTPEQFSHSAIQSLQWLGDNPTKVPRQDKEELSSFFVSLESIAGKSGAYSDS